MQEKKKRCQVFFNNRKLRGNLIELLPTDSMTRRTHAYNSQIFELIKIIFI